LPMLDRQQQPLTCHISEEWPCLHSRQHICTYASINATTGMCCPRPKFDQYRCDVYVLCV
jgi:hypothetical protein